MSSSSMLRIAAFLVLAVHMQAGPLLRQVFHRAPPPLGMAWQMYSGRGHNVCAVQWFAAEASGYEPLDRLEVLGVTEPWKADYKTRFQHNLREIKVAAQTICKKAPLTDVRARARCGVQRGLRWNQVVDVDTPLCEKKSPPKPPRPRARP